MSGSPEFEAGRQVGYVIGYLFPVIIGVVASFLMRRKREDKKWPTWPIVVGMAVTGLAFLGNMMNG